MIPNAKLQINGREVDAQLTTVQSDGVPVFNVELSNQDSFKTVFSILHFYHDKETDEYTRDALFLECVNFINCVRMQKGPDI